MSIFTPMKPGVLTTESVGIYKSNSEQLVSNSTNTSFTIQTGLSEVKHFLLEGHQANTVGSRVHLEYHADGFVEDSTVKIIRYVISSSTVYDKNTSGVSTLAAGTYAPGLISISGGDVTIQMGTGGTWYVTNFMWYAG